LLKYLIAIFLLAVSNLRAGPRIEEESIGLTKYRPIYFLYGSPTSKLQFSFKYQLIRVWPIYAGFTQYMFWELLHDSAPFRDVNYNPEFFNRFSFDSSIVNSLDFGYEHLSNGEKQDKSRSIDKIYTEVHLQGDNGTGAGWELGLRLRYAFRRGEEHSDFDRYAGGMVSLTGRLTHVFGGLFDQGAFSFKINPGGKWANEFQYGNQEVGFSFRLGGIQLAPSIYLQYFHGYAESMLNYDQEEQNFRVGILL